MLLQGSKYVIAASIAFPDLSPSVNTGLRNGGVTREAESGRRSYVLKLAALNGILTF